MRWAGCPLWGVKELLHRFFIFIFLKTRGEWSRRLTDALLLHLQQCRCYYKLLCWRENWALILINIILISTAILNCLSFSWVKINFGLLMQQYDFGTLCVPLTFIPHQWERSGTPVVVINIYLFWRKNA